MLNFLRHPIVTALRYIQFIVAVSLFFFAALAPADDLPSKIPAVMLHIVGNVLLFSSAWLALFLRLKNVSIFAFTLATSTLSEVLQGLTASRVVDPVDIAANAVGILIGMLLCLCFWYLIKKQTEK